MAHHIVEVTRMDILIHTPTSDAARGTETIIYVRSVRGFGYVFMSAEGE